MRPDLGLRTGPFADERTPPAADPAIADGHDVAVAADPTAGSAGTRTIDDEIGGATSPGGDGVVGVTLPLVEQDALHGHVQRRQAVWWMDGYVHYRYPPKHGLLSM